MKMAFPPAWFVLTLGVVVLLAGTFELPLLDRDEPRFSRATVEMAERGNWVIPYFNGQYRFDKPPLTYWWMGIHHWILGVSEFSSRLHSILSTLLVASWMFYRGRQWVGESAAAWGALIWLLNLQVWQHGRLALADMPMILGVCLAMDGLWNCLFGENVKRGRCWLMLWGGLAFGFLAKGPIVPILVLLVLLALLLSKKATFLQLRKSKPLTGVLFFLLLVGIWGIPALIETDGEFGREGIGKHVVERGISAFNERSYSPFFYAGTVFLSIFPWSLRLVALVSPLLGFWRTKEQVFLFFWFLLPLLVFSGYSTQLPHYILPGFPALFLLLGKGLVDSSTNKRKPWLELSISLLLITVVFCGKDQFSMDVPLTLLLCLTGVLLSFLWLPWLSLKKQFIGLFIFIISLSIFSFFAARNLRSEHLTIRIADEVGEKGKRFEERVSQFAEPSLVYYLGGPWKFGDPLSLESNSSSFLHIIRDEPDEKELWRRVEGFNPGRGKREIVWIQTP
jgi:4-amino-4-deoxy-L-arabinose transferase-like glycosyltransferase